MPLVNLTPGHHLSLSGGDHDSVADNSHAEGAFSIAYNLMPLTVQHTIAPGSRVTFQVPQGGATISNDVKVPLTVTTPGL